MPTMTDDGFETEERAWKEQWRAAEAQRKADLAVLRARARKLGMTIRSSSHDYYYLGPPNRRLICSVQCHGLRDLEEWIARFERALEGIHGKPTDEQFTFANRMAHEMFSEDLHQQHLVSTCAHCGEHPGDEKYGEHAWLGSEGYEFWVHRRCKEAYLQAWR
jgi:hypothetical protein